MNPHGAYRVHRGNVQVSNLNMMLDTRQNSHFDLRGLRTERSKASLRKFEIKIALLIDRFVQNSGAAGSDSSTALSFN